MSLDLRNVAGEEPGGRPVVKSFRSHFALRPVLWLTVLVIVTFFVWAANAPLDQVTRGMGKVAPLSRGQIIQSLEGGIISAIEVREGEEVAAGQMLAALDDTRFRTAFQDMKGQTVTLRATLSRLHAEQAGAEEVTFDPEVAEHREVVAAERQLFEARRRKFTEPRPPSTSVWRWRRSSSASSSPWPNAAR